MLSTYDKLADALRHNAQIVGVQNRLLRASLKQFFGLQDLCDRYSLGSDSVLALLKKHCGYVGAKGIPVRIHVDDVLRLDDLLREGAHA